VWLPVAEKSTLSFSYSLSCHLEPPQERAGKMRRFFLPKKNRASLSSGLGECPDRQGLKPGAPESFGLSTGLGRWTAGTGIPAPLLTRPVRDNSLDLCGTQLPLL